MLPKALAFFLFAAVLFTTASLSAQDEKWAETYREGDWTVFSHGWKDQAEAVTDQGILTFSVVRTGDCEFEIALKNACHHGIQNFAMVTRGSTADFVQAACYRPKYAEGAPSWHARAKCSTWNPEAFSNVEAFQFAFAREDGTFDIVNIPLNGLSRTVQVLQDTILGESPEAGKTPGQEPHGEGASP